MIGSTNSAEGLDKLLLRPGRFDKHVNVPLPDVGRRNEILELYAEKAKLTSDVDLIVLTKETMEFSSTNIYNLMNQASLKVSIDRLNSTMMAVLKFAKDKVIMEAKDRTTVITPKTTKFTLYQDMEYALVGVLEKIFYFCILIFKVACLIR